MIKTISNPTGIDWHLQQAQGKLYAHLQKVWGAGDYHCYGRAYRNAATGGGYIAEVYEGEGRYKEVYWDSQLSAISFFGIGPKSTKEAAHQLDVHLVFFANLEKLKPGITHRADEEVRQDVYNAFGPAAYGLTYDSTELYLENVLREYKSSLRDERLRTVDMHPVHCFRLNYTLSYNPNKTQLKF